MTLFDVLNITQVCSGTANATHMECFAPVFPRNETDKGSINVSMDGAINLVTKNFEYQPDASITPFEYEGNVLSLSPGQTEVSLHVRSQSYTQDSALKRASYVVSQSVSQSIIIVFNNYSNSRLINWLMGESNHNFCCISSVSS